MCTLAIEYRRLIKMRSDHVSIICSEEVNEVDLNCERVDNIASIFHKNLNVLLCLVNIFYIRQPWGHAGFLPPQRAYFYKGSWMRC